MLLISTGDLFPLGRRLAQHRAAIAAAVEAKIAHVVYTSGPAPYPVAGGALIDDHFWTEAALFASPLGWTVLRHQLYADTQIGALTQAAASGQLFSSMGAQGSNYVTREDCARVDAAALAADFDGRRVLDVTGPAPVTQQEIAAIGTELTGKPIRYVPITADAQRDSMAKAGLPPFLIDALARFQRAGAEGYLAITAPTVEQLTGKPPTALREFLTANRAALLPKSS
jgi:NAD(P)H dehydrogenase (quinone)